MFKTVTITAGTVVYVTDEDNEVTRYVVEDGDTLEMVIERKGCCHSTMTGGGHDYYGYCPHSLLGMRVRTSFSRDERVCFA